MEAIRRQASKLREQVAKQQQAVLRQLGKEAAIFDDDDLQRHQKLEDLCKSTRAAKHFQRDIVRGVEGVVLTSKKQMEVVRKLAEDCCNYGTVNQSAGFPLARAAVGFGNSRGSVEEEREIMLGILVDQVSEPLRASISGAPLEDARHLVHSCDRLRQEVEAQALEVLRRQSRCREASVESLLKLKSSEAKLTELRSALVALEREATSAMLSVEDQQQQITWQKLFVLVDTERCYHEKALSILEELHDEIIPEMHLQESATHSDMVQRHLHVPLEDNAHRGNNGLENENKNNCYFIGKVIHSFDAQADGELSISADDYVVVRQVAPTGWSEGECHGKAGWFPSAYVERQDTVPATKISGKTDSPA